MMAEYGITGFRSIDMPYTSSAYIGGESGIQRLFSMSFSKPQQILHKTCK